MHLSRKLRVERNRNPALCICLAAMELYEERYDFFGKRRLRMSLFEYV